MFICKVFLKSVFPYTSKTPIYKYTNISPEFGLQTLKTWIKKKIRNLFRETFYKNSLLFRWVFPQKNQGNCDGDKMLPNYRILVMGYLEEILCLFITNCNPKHVIKKCQEP